MTGIGLTAGQAARRLGVAVTTLRSWHRRYGLGPSQHVAGQHRRYSEDDLDRLETMRTLTAQGVPAAQAARLAIRGGLSVSPVSAEESVAEQSTVAPAQVGSGRSRSAVRGLVRVGLQLDAAAVRRQLAAAIASYGVVSTWEELIRPTLTEIEARPGGRRRGFGNLVAAEHLFSRCVSEVFGAVPRPVSPPRVLLACADDEQHSLPLEALAAALAERAVGNRLLGARVPPAALQATVRRTGPALVVLWSQTPPTADPAPLRALLVARPRPSVVAAAGPGWAELPAGVTALASLPAAVALATTVASVG